MPHSSFARGTNVAVFPSKRCGHSVDADLPPFMFTTNFLFILIEDLITCNRVFLKSGTGRARMLALHTVSSGINRRTLPRISLPTRGGQLRPFLPSKVGTCAVHVVGQTWVSEEMQRYAVDAY